MLINKFFFLVLTIVFFYRFLGEHNFVQMSATAKRKRSIFDDSDEDDESSDIKESKSEAPQQEVSDPSKNRAKRRTEVEVSDPPKNNGKKRAEVHVEKRATASLPEQSENVGGKGPPTTPVKDNDNSEMETKEKLALSPAQRARMEQKRQQALLLKQEKMNRRNPYTKNE